MTHGFNLEDTFGENTIANQGLIALYYHKIQTEVKYILSFVKKSGQGLGFFSLYGILLSHEFYIL